MYNQEVPKSAVRGLNDKAGPNMLFPALLVLEIMLCTTLTPTAVPKQVERLIALDEARKEIVQITAASKVSKAFRSQLTAAAITHLRIGDDVLMYRNESDSWQVPYKVLDTTCKTLKLSVKGRSVQFPADKVKQYKRDTLINPFKAVEKVLRELNEDNGKMQIISLWI